MVPLNHDFISTCLDTCGNTRYFAFKMPKSAMEIKFAMRRVVEFPLDEMWNFHETGMAFSQAVTFPQDMTLDLHT